MGFPTVLCRAKPGGPQLPVLPLCMSERHPDGQHEHLCLRDTLTVSSSESGMTVVQFAHGKMFRCSANQNAACGVSVIRYASSSCSRRMAEWHGAITGSSSRTAHESHSFGPLFSQCKRNGRPNNVHQQRAARRRRRVNRLGQRVSGEPVVQRAERYHPTDSFPLGRAVCLEGWMSRC